MKIDEKHDEEEKNQVRGKFNREIPIQNWWINKTQKESNLKKSQFFVDNLSLFQFTLYFQEMFNYLLKIKEAPR